MVSRYSRDLELSQFQVCPILRYPLSIPPFAYVALTNSTHSEYSLSYLALPSWQS